MNTLQKLGYGNLILQQLNNIETINNYSMKKDTD